MSEKHKLSIKIISKYDKNHNINDKNTFFKKVNQVVIKMISNIKVI
ncbi:hypothetical protein [Mycoplasmopsis felis]